MDMRSARMAGMCALVIVGLGCSKVSKDNSKIIANVGGEKISEKAFAEMVHALLGDEARATELLTSPAKRDERNRLLQEIVEGKAMGIYGDKQGLAKDPKAKALMDAAKANAYAQVLMDRRLAGMKPTDAQLRTLYDGYAAKAKAAGQEASFPPFESVRPQLGELWKREQLKEASATLIKDAKAQVPTTIEPEWKAAPAPAQMQ